MMSIELRIEEMSGYLAARYFGEGTVAECLDQLEFIAEACRRANNNKLLIDYTGAKVEDVNFVDRFEFGERLQIFWRDRIKIAGLLTQAQIDPQKFGEQVARNRSVNVRAFT